MAKHVLRASVFLIAFLAFSYNLWQIDIASGWIDPLLHYGAQDEATYTAQAIHMATQGDWMTPQMLGRWVLEKPPLLMWLSAISMKIFGIGPFTSRLPAVLAGALIVALCFAIACKERSAIAAVASALLCISNQVLFTMSRHTMTDILLTAGVVVTLGVLIRDPALARRSSQVVFTLAITAGILSKSIAGLLPAFAALLFAGVSSQWHWARLRRTAVLAGLGILLASPWFLYQLSAHAQWFLADMRFQIVDIGLQPRQAPTEGHLRFYLTRCIYAAPLTVALVLSGLPALTSALRRRETAPLLLSCFLVVLGGALLLFRFQSEPYLTPLFPVLILTAAITSPLFNRSLGRFAVAAIAVLFLVKAANPNRLWGISYQPGSTVAAADALSGYCAEHRGNDLYILGVDDQFYALVLPLARLHYGWVDERGDMKATRPHLLYLGIVQDPSSTGDPALYASRLSAWGLHSTAPLATGIAARSLDDLSALVFTHPESDFLVSEDMAARLRGRAAQQAFGAKGGVVLLQSKILQQPQAAAAWTCDM